MATLELANLNEDRASIPAEACRLTGSAVTFGDNGDSAKTIPVRLVARSPDPIEHWYWGNIVHNLSGAFLRDGKSVLESGARINLDYGHDDDKVIGFANHFEITEEGLVLSGALVPMPDGFSGEDHAQRVIHLARNGVPFESSINFGGSGVKLRVMDESETEMVNGQEFAGPGIIVEEWPLRNCAICSLGADGATKSELLSHGDEITVAISKTEDTEMSDSLITPDLLEDVAGNATELDSPSVEAVTVPDSDESGDAQPDVDSHLSRSDAARFVETFGEVPGSVYFTQGLSFETACAAHIAAQAETINDLTNKLAASAAGQGADECLSANDGDFEPKPGLVPSRNK